MYAAAEAPLAAGIVAMRRDVARLWEAWAVSPDELLELAIRLAFVKRAMNLLLSRAEDAHMSARDMRVAMRVAMRAGMPGAMSLKAMAEMPLAERKRNS